MPYRPNDQRSRPGMYNTPSIRSGGFGALQVEAITNRPLSIARRHLAASTLRMRDIEPEELSSSEWCRFLVMEDMERDRWITHYLQSRRRSSDGSTDSGHGDAAIPYDKVEEARREVRCAEGPAPHVSPTMTNAGPATTSFSTGQTPLVSIWARHFDQDEAQQATRPTTERRPLIVQRAVADEALADAPPPAYETVVRAHTPPPAYDSRRNDRASPQ